MLGPPQGSSQLATAIHLEEPERLLGRALCGQVGPHAANGELVHLPPQGASFGGREPAELITQCRHGTDDQAEGSAVIPSRFGHLGQAPENGWPQRVALGQRRQELAQAELRLLVPGPGDLQSAKAQDRTATRSRISVGDLGEGLPVAGLGLFPPLSQRCNVPGPGSELGLDLWRVP